MNALLARIVEQARRTMDAEAALLLLREGEELVVAGWAGLDEAMVAGRRLDVRTSLTGTVVRERRPLVCPDLLADPDWRDSPVARQLGYRAMLAVPLTLDREVLGVLKVLHRAPRPTLPGALALLEALATQAALAVENARLLAESERRRGEAERLARALREQQERLRTIIDAEPECVKVVAADGTLLEINPAGLALLEADAETDVLGRPAEALVAPEDRVRFRDFHERVCRGEAGTLEFRIVGLRGTTRWVESRAVPVRYGPDGRTVHLGIARDVTARHRAEARARALAAVARELAGTRDLAPVMDRIVTAVRQLLQVRRATLWRRLPDTGALVCVAASGAGAETWLGRTLPPGTGFAALALASERPVWSRDALADPRVSLPPWLEARYRAEGLRAALVVPLRGRRRAPGTLGLGDVLGRVFTPEDIELATAFADHAAVALENAELFQEAARQRQEAIEAYQELADTQARLLQIQKMEAVGRLAGGVAHDFNNLLTVILGRTDLLLRGTRAGDPAHRDLQLVRATAERAAAITRQLLAFGQKQVLRRRRLDLRQLVTDLGHILRALIGEHIELRMVVGADPLWVQGDPAQLEQVLLNLAVNARDAMPRGGRLTLETTLVEPDEAFLRAHPDARPGRYCLLTVTDTGTGMDEHASAHLFEPFFTTKAPGQGTGLGLATVYGIVRQHGGLITVETGPGRGTTFRVYLPWVAETGEPAPPEPAALGDGTGRETILLVEDDDEVRALVRDILASHGYTVLEAARPTEALRLVGPGADPFDLVLTDVVMPEMSGPELVERLGRLRPEVRALYVSGYAADALARYDARAAGIPILPKPFSPEALVRRVREILDGR